MKCQIGTSLALMCALTGLGQLPAFPGAEGFGKFATGGRGGTVYHVTNLDDSGPGSFRDAVSQAHRTVVFDVGGVIAYTGNRYNIAHNVTIAGQTAPGDGVVLYGDGIGFSGSDNTITRFIRFRMGINGTSGKDALGISDGHDMIFDHVSVSWGRDETFSVSADTAPYPTNITIQSCIISQGLQGHSAGGLIQTPGGVSILRCLYIDNDTRNPKVKFVNEFVNNVVYGWETAGYIMGGDSAGDSYANAFNNYFINGPNNAGPAFSGGNENFHIYATNNWQDANRNGVLDGAIIPLASYGSMDWQPTPFAYPVTNAYPPLTALKLAISDVGSSQPRDQVDERMITELTSYGTLGETITSELVPPMDGPGLVRNGTPYTDTDQDGMPDFWEQGTGSNPGVANNNDPSPSGSGYTRLEDYLNWLAEPHGLALPDTTVGVDLRQFTRGFANRNPAYSISDISNGAVALIDGYIARFDPAAGHVGPAGFQFTVVDADGSSLTRTLNLFFTPVAHSFNPTWHGDDVSNNWNVAGDYNWFDGKSLLYPFHDGDDVTFDDSGSTHPAVNLVGTLQPSSVTLDSANNYIFSGPGSLDGSMGLLLAGEGRLTINTTNHYSGSTTVSNGTLIVNGSLDASAVSVLGGATIGGDGRLGQGLTVQTGGAIAPGDGVGSTGRLTVTNGLVLSGVTNRFDLSDDPTGTVKANDRIDVIGDLSLSGINPIQVNLLDGPLADGVYVLFTYTGTLAGSLANFTVVGANGTLTNPPGVIALHVDNTRPPAALTWFGNGVNNIWDTGTNANWLNGTSQDRFYFLDSVRFDDTGSATPSVALAGTLTPASVTVDASANYAFSGTGRISGTGGLTKTNSGVLSILTLNDYTGPTIIGSGTLTVTTLANAGSASGIGASGSDPANLVFYGGTLRYPGANTTTDHGMTFNNAGAAIDVTSAGTELIDNGTLIGPGGFTKTGSGTFTLTAENTFSGGTVISNGTLALFGPAGGATTTANDYALGSGSVTFHSGTLRLFGGGLGDASAGYGTFSRPMIVPAGETGTILTPARYTMSSTLTGSGTLNIEVNYVRGFLRGNWSGFNGVINVTARAASSGASEFRVANSTGYPGATILLNNNVVVTRSGGATTMRIGALGGTTGSSVGPGNKTSSGTTYSVGWNNADATFHGIIKNDGTTTVSKNGTGRWTLTGANSWSGGTAINGGIILADNTSGSALGSGAVTVNNTGALGGTGSVGAPVSVNGGGILAPGDNGPGTLTINNNLSLNGAAVLSFELGSLGASDRISVNGSLALGGVLNATGLAGFGPGAYTLFTYTGSLSGTPPSIGSKPSGYTCTVNTALAGRVRLLVQAQAPPMFDPPALADGWLVLSGSGPTNENYYVLSSTNLSQPVAEWTRIATNRFSSNGAFVFTNQVVPGEPSRFYLLELP